MGLKSEILAFVFGLLLILVTFGDNHLGRVAGVAIGNLDTIFGYGLWPVMDVIFPLATIVVFLLYGFSKGFKLRINKKTSFLFFSFLLVLCLINLDDIGIALHFELSIPFVYWLAISWIYPVYGAMAFFFFGNSHKEKVV